MHLFPSHHIGRAHQFRGDSARPFVVEVRSRHCGAVDLRLHDDPLHDLPYTPRSTGAVSTPSRTTSITRVPPILAASTIWFVGTAVSTSVNSFGSTRSEER